MFTSPMPRSYDQPYQVTPGDTNWHVIGVKSGSLTLYSSVAALNTDGAKEFPNKDQGYQNIMMNVHSLATGGTTAGSAMFFWFNTATAPTYGKFVDAGKDISVESNIYNVWVKMTASTDIAEIVISG